MYQVPLPAISYDDMLEAIKISSSIKDVLTIFGWPPHVTYYKRLRIRCQELGLELPKFTQRGKFEYPLDEVLRPGVRYDRTKLKQNYWILSALLRIVQQDQ
jgi:hypothetical protein